MDTIGRLRGWIFRAKCKITMKKIKIGKNLILRAKLGLNGPGKIKLGDSCIVEGVCGDKHRYVTLYTHSPDAIIEIGDNVRLRGTRISARYSITIGCDAYIENVGIADTDFHSIDRNRESTIMESIEKCRVVICQRVAIGNGALVGKGIVIGEDAIIAPGSVLNCNIPPLCFAAGNPAKIIKRVTIQCKN